MQIWMSRPFLTIVIPSVMASLLSFLPSLRQRHFLLFSSRLFPSLPFPYLGAPRIRGIHLLLPTPYRTTAPTLHLYLAHPTPPHLHLTSYSSFKCLKAAMRCVVELLEAPAPILLTALRCLQKKKDVYAVIFKSPAQTLLEDRGRVEKCLG